MIQKQFRIKYWIFGLVLSTLLLSACKKNLPNGGVYFPIKEQKPDYPIDVFYENNLPDFTYETIKDLEITEQKALGEKDKPVGGRMLYRGITKEQKDALINRLIIEAQELGASAVIKVKYQYFTAANYDGYQITGQAIKYKVKR